MLQLKLLRPVVFIITLIPAAASAENPWRDDKLDVSGRCNAIVAGNNSVAVVQCNQIAQEIEDIDKRIKTATEIYRREPSDELHKKIQGYIEAAEALDVQHRKSLAQLRENYRKHLFDVDLATRKALNNPNSFDRLMDRK